MPGREQHPPAHPELEVGGDREAGEDATQGRGLEQDEAEDEGRVALRVVEVGCLGDRREAAGEGGEEEEREDQRGEEDRRFGEGVVEAAPGDSERRGSVAAGHERTIRSRSASEAIEIEPDDQRDRDAEGERQRFAVPADHEEAADSLDQVADRVDRRDRPEPVLLDQVAGQRDRAEEEEDEEQREHALDRFPRAGPDRHEHPDPAEADRDQHREREQDRDAGEAGFEVGAGGEPDERGRRSPGRGR